MRAAVSQTALVRCNRQLLNNGLFKKSKLPLAKMKGLHVLKAGNGCSDGLKTNNPYKSFDFFIP